jgi:hypothetical protein
VQLHDLVFESIDKLLEVMIRPAEQVKGFDNLLKLLVSGNRAKTLFDKIEQLIIACLRFHLCERDKVV